MKDQKLVSIVHSIDTEGPLYESLDAKFERLEELFKITDLPRTKETLQRLQKQQIDLNGEEENVANMLNGHRVNYNDSWDKIDEMLQRISTGSFRNKMNDSYGGGWVFNWHCMDHVDYNVNPRRRDIGYHNIYDHYVSFLERNKKPNGVIMSLNKSYQIEKVVNDFDVDFLDKIDDD